MTRLRRATLRTAVAAMILALASGAEVPASERAPGGLQPSETPQFVLWS